MSSSFRSSRASLSAETPPAALSAIFFSSRSKRSAGNRRSRRASARAARSGRSGSARIANSIAVEELVQPRRIDAPSLEQLKAADDRIELRLQRARVGALAERARRCAPRSPRGAPTAATPRLPRRARDAVGNLLQLLRQRPEERARILRPLRRSPQAAPACRRGASRAARSAGAKGAPPAPRSAARAGRACRRARRCRGARRASCASIAAASSSIFVARPPRISADASLFLLLDLGGERAEPPLKPASASRRRSGDPRQDARRERRPAPRCRRGRACGRSRPTSRSWAEISVRCSSTSPATAFCCRRASANSVARPPSCVSMRARASSSLRSAGSASRRSASFRICSSIRVTSCCEALVCSWRLQPVDALEKLLVRSEAMNQPLHPVEALEDGALVLAHGVEAGDLDLDLVDPADEAGQAVLDVAEPVAGHVARGVELHFHLVETRADRVERLGRGAAAAAQLRHLLDELEQLLADGLDLVLVEARSAARRCAPRPRRTAAQARPPSPPRGAPRRSPPGAASLPSPCAAALPPPPPAAAPRRDRRAERTPPPPRCDAALPRLHGPADRRSSAAALASACRRASAISAWRLASATSAWRRAASASAFRRASAASD